MEYIEAIINQYSQIPDNERLALFNLSRISNVLNFCFMMIENNKTRSNILERAFSDFEIQIMLIGCIYASLQYYIDHMYLLNPTKYNESDNKYLEKLRNYIQQMSKNDSYISLIIKPMRNQFMFHFDDAIYKDLDKEFIEKGSASFLSTQKQTTKDSFYHLPLGIIWRYSKIAHENKLIDKNEFTKMFQLNVRIGVDILRTNEKVIKVIIRGKCGKIRRSDR